MAAQAIVEAIFTGQPKSMTDERGPWTSSICFERSTQTTPSARQAKTPRQ